jgi:hypothetical protein
MGGLDNRCGSRGLCGTAALGSVRLWNQECFSKTVAVRKSNGHDFLENKLYEDRLAEFKQDCAESGLGRMYRRLGRARQVATLLSKPRRIGHSWN